MKKYRTYISIAVVAIGCAFAVYKWMSGNPDSEIIATVNGEPITMHEYLNRYYKYLIQTGIRDNMATRHIVLRDMINERLMLDDIHTRRWDQGPEYDRIAEEATIQVLLDNFRHRMIMDTMDVREDEVRQAFARSQTRLSVRHLYAKTEEDAWQLKRALDQGESFETLARRAFRDPRLASNGGYIGFIGPGDADPAFEDAAYSLPVGTVSNPVKTAEGYSIIKVEKRVSAPLASQYDYEAARNSITRTLRGAKLVKEGQQFANSLVNKNEVVFSEPLLAKLFDHWKESDQAEPLEVWGDTLARDQVAGTEQLLQFRTTRWTMKDFLHRISFTTPRQRSWVRSPDDLREFILGLLTRDIMVEKAKDAGLDKEPGVRSEVHDRINYFLMDKWRDAAQDSVNYEESPPAGLSEAGLALWNRRHALQENKLRQHFDRKTEIYRYPDEVRVREILVRTNQEAVDITREYLAGRDFGQLAHRYSRRLWAAVKGGDMGFHTSQEYGDLGQKIFSVKPGTLIGPVPTDSGFSIVQVLDRRQGREKTYDEAKPEIAEELHTIWKNFALTNALARLQQQSTVAFDTLKLQTISYKDPMLLVHGSQGD